MVLNVEELRETLNGLKVAGSENFDCIPYMDDDSILSWSDHYSDCYWEQLDDVQQGISIDLQSNLLKSVKMISNCITHSPLLMEADHRDLSRWAKSLRSALRLREYHAWDPKLLHDEGTVLGFQPSGQSDDNPMHREKARLVFERGINNLLNLVDLIELVFPERGGGGVKQGGEGFFRRGRSRQVQLGHEPLVAPPTGLERGGEIRYPADPFGSGYGCCAGSPPSDLALVESDAFREERDGDTILNFYSFTDFSFRA